jgi:hypothetical protein
MPSEVANLQHACWLCETQIQPLVYKRYIFWEVVIENISYALKAPVGG